MNTAELTDLLRELADDLAAELDARHKSRDRSPTIMRDFERDMTPVRRAYALLAKLEEA